MIAKTYNILFLCTGNSARSILAEGLITHLSGGRFHGFSAGSYPTGRVNPFALEALKQFGCDTTNCSSKSWDVFAEPDAPRMDFVITVCDNAAGEVCPIWPGHPMTAHWGFADPSHVEGDAATRQAAFMRTANAIAHRLRLFLSIPIEKLDRMALTSEIKSLGEV
ncbi:MAG: arsenate reductase ArsC [Dokdonella sp.]